MVVDVDFETEETLSPLSPRPGLVFSYKKETRQESGSRTGWLGISASVTLDFLLRRRLRSRVVSPWFSVS